MSTELVRTIASSISGIIILNFDFDAIIAPALANFNSGTLAPSFFGYYKEEGKEEKEIKGSKVSVCTIINSYESRSSPYLTHVSMVTKSLTKSGSTRTRTRTRTWRRLKKQLY